MAGHPTIGGVLGARVRRWGRGFAALVGALVGLTMLAVGAATPRAEAFPVEQLARGEEVWKSICSRCHGPESDNPDAPLLLRPNAFKTFANGADIFQYVRDSMPGDEPASLAEEQYWDVLAFLLAQQGISNGDAVLGPENAMSVPTTKAP